MSSDRWRRIDELCNAALEIADEDRSMFLVKACGGDDVLRQEVESLLAQEPRAERFMRAPAVASAPSVLMNAAKGTVVGPQFGAYSIRARIGVGGMGEVYRAHDTALGREVAIKVLPPAFTADPERRARLEREARMLAALNHPHIGAIYGIEEAGGVRGLILELVEGETLAEKIAASRRGLPIAQVRAIARQVADALDVAHEKGIVHRDLKPANIKITPDGIVKVLDFGLAKAAVPHAGEPAVSDSQVGVILGTAAYMSPEQARGHSVDKRGDIWAFGCVLYEMLTGRLAFPGETTSDIIAKVIEREPNWSALPVNTPAGLRRLVQRCLTKDPKQRVRDIGDVKMEIDVADDPSSRPAVLRRAWLPWVTSAALGLAIATWLLTRPAAVPESPLAHARFTRFTDWPGTEGLAEISPDGKFVAFLADRSGESDLWLSQVGTGRFTNVTADMPPMPMPSADSLLRSFGFSADGGEIWFSTTADPGSRKLIMPLTGGTKRAFLGEGDAAPSWSPDGARLAYFNNRDGDPLLIADRAGRDPRELLPRRDGKPEPGLHNHNPVWSHDGEWIYYVHGVDPTVKMDVWRIRASGGSPEQVTRDNAKLNFLAPLNSRTLLYIAQPQDQAGPWLWSLDIPTSLTRRESWGLEQYTSVAASRDGRRVVATVASPSTTLWRLPILDRMAVDSDVQPYPLPTTRALAPRFAGSSLFYLSARGAGDGLWRFEKGETFEVWTSADGALSEPPAVSADGRHVAVIVRQSGKGQLITMSADGANSRTLAASIDIRGAANQSSVDWSPDGRWIIASGRDAQGPGLFKIPADGSIPVRLLTGQATNPVWSPDGNLIVYSGPLVAGQVPLLAMRPDGSPLPMPQLRVRAGGYRFMPGGTRLVYVPRMRSVDFWLLDLTTQSTRQLTSLSDLGVLRTFDIALDGSIVFDRSRDSSDIVLIDLPQP
jgi:serine/threonine protein kinase/Tol biopolymer transport system component